MAISQKTQEFTKPKISKNTLKRLLKYNHEEKRIM